MTSVPLHFTVSGDDFTCAGEASSKVKNKLKQLGYNSEAIRRAAIAMYEGEINMVIHGRGGKIFVEVYPDHIDIKMQDKGPGIENIEQAMQEGYSTAPANVRALGFGAGMGLPNIKKYTDGLRIESEVGKGTTIYMTVQVHES